MIAALADRAGADAAAAGIPSAEPHTVDLADPDATAALAQALLDRHGRVDVLVNNAAQLGTHDAAELSVPVVGRFPTVTVEAPLLLVQALAPTMAAAGRAG